MEKRLDLKEVEKILQDAVNQDLEGLDKDIVITRTLMKIAKEDLIATFTDRQKKLYQKALFHVSQPKVVGMRILIESPSDNIEAYGCKGTDRYAF